MLPECVRDAVLAHCLHDNGVKAAVHAVVVMPDHVHLLLTPGIDVAGQPYGLAEIIGAMKGASAHTVNRLLGRTGHVWQDESFDHELRTNESAAAKAVYLCANPVRRGLVECADDYRWLWQESDGVDLP